MKEIERNIIGATVFFNEYHKVSFLKPSNFTVSKGEDRQEIWRVMGAMFPEKRMDMSTVAYELSRAGVPHASRVIAFYVNRVTSPQHLERWAVMLLEHGMSEATVSLFEEMLVNATGDVLRSSRITEILVHLYDGGDLFDAIEAAEGYFSTFDMDVELSKTQELKKKIGDRAFEVATSDRQMSIKQQYG